MKRRILVLLLALLLLLLCSCGHKHSYAGGYSSDENYHWKECSCEEKIALAFDFFEKNGFESVFFEERL